MPLKKNTMFVLSIVLLVSGCFYGASTKTNICIKPDKRPVFNVSVSMATSRVNSSLIQRVKTNGLMICLKECLLQTDCVFFYFNSTSGNCQLRREGGFKYISASNQQFDYHGNISQVNRAIAGDCEAASCPPGYKCLADRDRSSCTGESVCLSGTLTSGQCVERYRCRVSDGGQLCVLLDCGLPPGSEYPTVVWEIPQGTAVHSMVRYHSPTFATLTCQSNGTWAGTTWPALPATCEEVERVLNTTGGGELWLYPRHFHGRRRVKIYCESAPNSTKVYHQSVSEHLLLKQDALVEVCHGEHRAVRTELKHLPLEVDTMTIKMSTEDLLQWKQTISLNQCQKGCGNCSVYLTELYINLVGTDFRFNLSTGSASLGQSLYEVNYTSGVPCMNCLPLELSLQLGDDMA